MKIYLALNTIYIKGYREVFIARPFTCWSVFHKSVKQKKMYLKNIPDDIEITCI